MAGLILLAFWMSVQEKSSVTVMEEKWIVLLLFPRSQKHGKIRTGAILKKWTAKSERWYNNKKRRERHGKHQVYRGIQAKHSKLV